MFLRFIGSGSAFNTFMGNNSAFIKKGAALLLLDCGSTTFGRMQEAKLLEDVKELYVLITHRHPDHIASLGDLIFYASYILKTKVKLLSPDQEAIGTLLKYMGVEEYLYTPIKLTGKYEVEAESLRVTIQYVAVEHVANMPSYGYLMEYEGTRIFYSGDARRIPQGVLEDFKSGHIQFIYQDVCSYDSHDGPHLHIDSLRELIEPEYRHRVFCMHRDESFDAEKATSQGFCMAENSLGKKF
jgi:ribonuclease BN (tRNA processing enzyme)